MTMSERFPRRSGTCTLVDRQPLSRRMLRLTLRAPDFRDAWPLQQPGEIITLLFAAPGEPIVLPVAGWTFPPGTEPQPWRNYTVRHHRPARGEIDVDVVLHDPPGPACSGACDLPIGAAVGYAGPRVDFAACHDADWLLLCGDETALPAIAAIAETCTPRAGVLALVEVADAGAQIPLDLPPGAEVRWVHRGDAPVATTTHLADALRELPLPAGAGQAWGAAESRVARELRMVLRDEHGLPRSRAHARGYWLRSGEWLDED
jgi:NADPH-dependent ferric siderophore reductase